MVPSDPCRSEMFPAVFDPFHWPLEFFCHYRKHKFLGVGAIFGAEAAADIRADDAYSALILFQETCHQPAYKERCLGREVDRCFIQAGIIVYQNIATFHGMASASMFKKIDIQNVIGLLEGFLDVAILVVEVAD